MMRMTRQKISIIILSAFSFFMLTLYCILNNITLNQNKDEFTARKLSTGQKNLAIASKEGTSLETDLIRSRLQQALQGYGVIIAVKETNKRAFSTQLACVSELYIVECNNAGLAGLLLMTLDHLSTCRHIGAVPTVFWHNCGTVCPSNATVNSWNWFFEPLNSNIEENAKRVLCFGSSFGPRTLSLRPGSKSNLTNFSELLNLSFQPRHAPGFNEYDLITPEIRLWANSLIKQYVKINPQIQEIVDKFYNEHLFGHTVLAIHVRGTDHAIETEEGKLPLLTSWIQNAKHILKSLPTPNKIFIASDNSESIKKFVNEFGKKVVFTKAIRAIKYHGKEVHHSNYDPYKLGAEVLIDILLMARADHFLHAESSVAALVSYFNPEIHTHFLESKADTDNKDGGVQSSQLKNTPGDSNVNTDSFSNDGYSDESGNLIEEDQVQCFQRNSQYSVCPNMKKRLFIDTKELQELQL